MTISTSSDQDRVIIRGSESSCIKALDAVQAIVNSQELRQERERELEEAQKAVESANAYSIASGSSESIGSEGRSSSTRVVPGWSKNQGIKTPITVSSTAVRSAATSAPIVAHTSSKLDTWKSVPRRGKTVDLPPPSATSGSSKRKKRKAKKNSGEATAAHPTVNVGEEEDAAIPRAKFIVGSDSRSTTGVIDASAASSKVSTRDNSRQSSPSRDKASPSRSPRQHSPQSAQRQPSRQSPRQPMPCQPSPKSSGHLLSQPVQQQLLPETAAEDTSISSSSTNVDYRGSQAPTSTVKTEEDEWQTITRGGGGFQNAAKPSDSGLSLASQSVNAAAAALGLSTLDSPAAEKKRKKRKKKKAPATGSVE